MDGRRLNAAPDNLPEYARYACYKAKWRATRSQDKRNAAVNSQLTGKWLQRYAFMQNKARVLSCGLRLLESGNSSSVSDHLLNLTIPFEYTSKNVILKVIRHPMEPNATFRLIGIEYEALLALHRQF